jgi:hypothetical protein
MQIQLEMGPEFQKTLAELGGMGDAVSRACGIGLGKVVIFAASHVVEKYLTGQYLKVRKGDMRRAVKGWMIGDFEGIVGVQENSAVDKYAWLLGDEEKTIRPGPGKKFLTIPIGEALTPIGTIKDEYSHGLRAITKGYFVNSKGRLLFGYKVGEKGKFRALFTLVQSVFIQGTGALIDYFLESIDNITGIIQEEVDKEVGKNG